MEVFPDAWMRAPNVTVAVASVLLVPLHVITRVPAGSPPVVDASDPAGAERGGITVPNLKVPPAMEPPSDMLQTKPDTISVVGFDMSERRSPVADAEKSRSEEKRLNSSHVKI